jgi:hypothetical protein
MPFASKKQRAYMHIHHPDIANRWEKEAKRKHQKAIQPKKRKR